MNKSLFTDSKTGQVVRITAPEPDWAFIPDPLPPDWDFAAPLWPLLVKAKEALGRLDGIGQTLPNPHLILTPLQQREALRSSSLEGTYASPQEVLLFELQPRRPKSEKDPLNAWLEVSNYGKALRQGYTQLVGEFPFSLRLIRNLHKCLLEGVRGAAKSPGEFRTYQVHVGSSRRYIPPPMNALGPCLDGFEKHLQVNDARYDPLVLCYLCHYQFEAIHPFIDGNGRVGRLLLALMTFVRCNLSMPWLYMSAFFERYKDEYIDRLFEVSTKGAWEAWIEFCLRGTVSQSNDAISRCHRLARLKDEFHQRLSGGSARRHTIMDDLFTSPVVTIPQIKRKHAVTYPTAKTDIYRLVDTGILRLVDGVNPKTFFSPEIFRIAYGEEQEE